MTKRFLFTTGLLAFSVLCSVLFFSGDKTFAVGPDPTVKASSSDTGQDLSNSIPSGIVSTDCAGHLSSGYTMAITGGSMSDVANLFCSAQSSMMISSDSVNGPGSNSLVEYIGGDSAKAAECSTGYWCIGNSTTSSYMCFVMTMRDKKSRIEANYDNSSYIFVTTSDYDTGGSDDIFTYSWVQCNDMSGYDYSSFQWTGYGLGGVVSTAQLSDIFWQYGFTSDSWTDDSGSDVSPPTSYTPPVSTQSLTQSTGFAFSDLKFGAKFDPGDSNGGEWSGSDGNCYAVSKVSGVAAPHWSYTKYQVYDSDDQPLFEYIVPCQGTFLYTFPSVGTYYITVDMATSSDGTMDPSSFNAAGWAPQQLSWHGQVIGGQESAFALGNGSTPPSGVTCSQSSGNVTLQCEDSIYVDCSQYNFVTDAGDWWGCHISNLQSWFRSLLINLFVPDPLFFSSMFNELNTTATNKLGVIYSPVPFTFNTLTTIGQGLTSSETGTTSLDFGTYFGQPFTLNFAGFAQVLGSSTWGTVQLIINALTVFGFIAATFAVLRGIL